MEEQPEAGGSEAGPPTPAPEDAVPEANGNSEVTIPVPHFDVSWIDLPVQHEQE